MDTDLQTLNVLSCCHTLSAEKYRIRTLDFLSEYTLLVFTL